MNEPNETAERIFDAINAARYVRVVPEHDIIIVWKGHPDNSTITINGFNSQFKQTAHWNIEPPDDFKWWTYEDQIRFVSQNFQDHIDENNYPY